MASLDRKEMILDLLKNNNRFATVEQLCKSLYVSGATIRRDLGELEASSLIRRTRGGAILLEGGTNEAPLNFRENQNVVQKQMIAGVAVKHVRDGMTIFMDPSSTVYTLAKRLEPFSNLRVITNGLKTADLLSNFRGVTVMCTGGVVRENSKSLVGMSAVDYLKHLNADIAFMSCRGFTPEKGAFEANEEEFYLKQVYLNNSRKAVLLLDSTKIGREFLWRIAPAGRFSDIITEKKNWGGQAAAKQSGLPEERKTGE